MKDKIIYINYPRQNPLDGAILKTNEDFYHVTGDLMGLMLSDCHLKPREIAEKMPACQFIEHAQHEPLYSFAIYVYNNDAASDKVPISRELKDFDTGIRKSHVNYHEKPVYVIDLEMVKKTHQGTNSRHYQKRVKKRIKREEYREIEQLNDEVLNNL